MKYSVLNFKYYKAAQFEMWCDALETGGVKEPYLVVRLQTRLAKREQDAQIKLRYLPMLLTQPKVPWKLSRIISIMLFSLFGVNKTKFSDFDLFPETSLHSTQNW